MTDVQELQAQGVFDAIRLLDKDLIDQILKLSKAVKIETLENGVTRVTVDLVPQGVQLTPKK